MRGIKKIIIILIGISLIYFITSCKTSTIIQKKSEQQKTLKEENKTEEVNDNLDELLKNKLVKDKPITKSMVTKMLALAMYSQSEINQYDREINFIDTDPNVWYDKYINIATINKWFKTEGNKFYPLNLLTYEEALYIVDTFKLPKEKIKIKWDNIDKKSPIVNKDWYQIYILLLKTIDIDHEVKSDKFILVGTPSNVIELNMWELVSDKGKYIFEGLTMDQYMDQKIKVLKRGSDIITVLEVLDKKPVLKNIWIDQINKNEMTIFVGGAFRTYNCLKGCTSNFEKKIADITLVNQKVSNCDLKNEKITGRVLKSSNTEIVIENLGTYKISKEHKVYSIFNGLKWKSLQNILVGYESADFIINKGEICAALIKTMVKPQMIRVVINTSDYKSLIHQTIQLTCNTKYSVLYNKEKIIYEKGKVFTIKPDSSMLNSYIKIQPIEKQGKIQILSIKRSYGQPIYRGNMEIHKTSKGMYLINEVPFEEYLYAVVPSEMPTLYGLEACKVQAVCARSYAYTQFLANKFCEYGAHVDDSVSCQVYNNTLENSISIKAVNDTKQLGLRYKDNVITAYFYSTSCGMSSSSGDVWADYAIKDFPAYTPEYAVGKSQGKKPIQMDLSKEEQFKTFIKNDNYESFDNSFAWFRWNVTMSCAELQHNINKNLENRYKIAPKLIKVLGQDKKFRSRPIKTIGNLKNIKIYSRSKSGIITEILITGSKATVKVATEYNIRLLLAPKKIEGGQDIIINRKDNSTVKNFSMMPSAYFTMDKKLNNQKMLQSVTFYGGGYGHGVGMSQNGVKGMVDQNYTFENILKHFYTGVKIEKIY